MRSVCFVLLFSVALFLQAQDLPEWARDPMNMPADQLQAALAQMETEVNGEPSAYLIKTAIRVDEEHRVQLKITLVYSILNKAWLDSASVQQDWKPWHENRPQIQARIISGTRESFLSAADLVERAAAGEDKIYSDQRSLGAPLPGVEIGSIIVLDITRSEHQPFYEVGAYGNFGFANMQAHLVDLTLDAPEGSLLKYQLKGLKKESDVQHISDNHLHFQWRELELVDRPEPLQVDYHYKKPTILFTTVSSWNELASSYYERVQQLLAHAQLPKTPKDLVVAGKPRQTAINLTHWINQQVRYTGMELGINAIVPNPPEEIFRRKYGDCKDKALLLVALLKQAGIEASLALLHSGVGAEPEAALPGFYSFNHMIVYLQNDKFWIDPTYELNTGEALPWNDLRKAALVVHPKTQGLTMTPTATVSDEQHTRIVRNVTMADFGRGSWSEERFYSGEIEAQTRDQALVEKALEPSFAHMTTKECSGVISNFQTSDPSDLKTQFKISFDVESPDGLFTGHFDAAVRVSPQKTIARIMREFTELDEERTTPAIYIRPFIYELELEVTPPPGFVLRQLPMPIQRQMGITNLQSTFQFKEGRLQAKSVFTYEKLVMSAEEYLETQAALRTYFKEPDELLMFDHEGELAWTEGDGQRSLQIFSDLASANPSSSAACDRYGRALVRAGLGAAARKEIQRGLTLAPEQEELLAAWAWVNINDLIGRELKPGWDPEEVIGTFEKLYELNPEKPVYLFQAAYYAEHNLEGIRYGKGADLTRAQQLYERLLKTDYDLSNNLQIVQAYAGHFEDLLESVKLLKNKTQAETYRMIALCALGRLDEALEESNKTAPNNRREIFANVSNMLKFLGYYEPAIAFLQKTLQGSNDPAETEGILADLRKMMEGSQKDINADTPEGFFGRLNHALLFGDLEPWICASSRAALKPGFQREVERVLIDELLPICREKHQVHDLNMGFSTLEVEGNPSLGYRAKTKFTGIDRCTLFLTQEQGELRLVGLDTQKEYIALHIQKLLEQQRFEDAYTWLDWICDGQVGTYDASDPLARRSLSDIWDETQPRTPERALLTTYAFMYSGDFSDRAVPILKTAYQQAEAPTKWRLAMLLLSASASTKEERLQLAREIYQAFPKSFRARQFLKQALASDPESLRAPLTAWLEEEPNQKFYFEAMQQLQRHLGGYAAEERYVLDLEAKGLAKENAYNNLAWYGLFEKTLPSTAISFGFKAAAGKERNSLHTLATLLAELGRCREARTTLDQAMAEGLREEDWYTLGRIAEHYGDIQGAIAAYQHFDTSKPFEAQDTSTAHLAWRRLKALKVI